MYFNFVSGSPSVFRNILNSNNAKTILSYLPSRYIQRYANNFFQTLVVDSTIPLPDMFVSLKIIENIRMWKKKCYYGYVEHNSVVAVNQVLNLYSDHITNCYAQ